MKCGDSINPGTLCWMQIIFWTVRFSSWNNLSCFFSLFLLMPLFFEHWEILFSHLSAPRTTLSLVYTSRKLRPSPALFTSCPQKPGLSVAHASQSFGIGCLVYSVTSSLTASRSLTSSPSSWHYDTHSGRHPNKTSPSGSYSQTAPRRRERLVAAGVGASALSAFFSK